MVREEMPEPDYKAFQKALKAAEREECRHKNDHQCHYGGNDCAKLKRLKKRWRRIHDQHYKAVNRYDARKHLPLPAERMAEAVALLVDETAKALFEVFVEKQTRKTDEIINGRAGHVSGIVQPTIWQSTLHFVLADSVRFEMRMKIVPKVSCCGNPFYQFPTTFHDAYDAKGEKVWASEDNLKDTLGVVEEMAAQSLAPSPEPVAEPAAKSKPKSASYNPEVRHNAALKAWVTRRQMAAQS
jgi:hypothetical protein